MVRLSRSAYVAYAFARIYVALSGHRALRVRAAVLAGCILFQPLYAWADHTPDPPRQTDLSAPSVSGLLDFSSFRYLGHVNPGGPYAGLPVGQGPGTKKR